MMDKWDTFTNALLNPKAVEERAYEMGYDCGMNGATEANSHFLFFTRPEYKTAWELGKAQAEQEKAGSS